MWETEQTSVSIRDGRDAEINRELKSTVFNMLRILKK